jgi:hypothetical protein
VPVETEAATEPVPVTARVAVSPFDDPDTTAPDDEIGVPADELAAGDGFG